MLGSGGTVFVDRGREWVHVLHVDRGQTPSQLLSTRDAGFLGTLEGDHGIV